MTWSKIQYFPKSRSFKLLSTTGKTLFAYNLFTELPASIDLLHSFNLIVHSKGQRVTWNPLKINICTRLVVLPVSALS